MVDSASEELFECGSPATLSDTAGSWKLTNRLAKNHFGIPLNFAPGPPIVESLVLAASLALDVCPKEFLFAVKCCNGHLVLYLLACLG